MSGSNPGAGCAKSRVETMRREIAMRMRVSGTSPTTVTHETRGGQSLSSMMTSPAGLVRVEELLGAFGHAGPHTSFSNANLPQNGSMNQCGLCGRDVASCRCDFGV